MMLMKRTNNRIVGLEADVESLSSTMNQRPLRPCCYMFVKKYLINDCSYRSSMEEESTSCTPITPIK